MAGKRSVVRQGIALLVTAWLVASSSSAAGEPIKVHLREGNARGFLVLHTAEGAPIAYGEFRQKPAGAMIESQLVLRFGDGSLRDEVATFSQAGHFRLEAYRLVQRGPSFPTTEISFARRTGQYTARTQEKKGDEEQTASGALEMPTDLYNGMAITLLKNLPVSGRAAAQMAVFTPKPRLIRMTLARETEVAARVGPERTSINQYLVKLEVTGITGVVASLLGKEPPDARYWFAAGDVPAFVRFEGAMYLHGPIWHLEQTLPELPR